MFCYIDLLDVLTRGQGAYLMEKTQTSTRHPYHTSHMTQRHGIRIVTAVQSSQSSTTHLPSITQSSLDRQQLFNDQIDLNKLAEDAADLFGDHGELALDPSLSEFALQVIHTRPHPLLLSHHSLSKKMSIWPLFILL